MDEEKLFESREFDLQEPVALCTCSIAYYILSDGIYQIQIQRPLQTVTQRHLQERSIDIQSWECLAENLETRNYLISALILTTFPLRKKTSNDENAEPNKQPLFI